MPYPNNSTVDLVILGQTIHVAVAEWEVNVVATFPATDIALPAGRWLVTPSLQSTPEALAGRAQGVAQDVTYGGGGGTVHIPAFTYRAYRNIDGTAQVLVAAIDIKLWNAGWTQYASAQNTAAIRVTDAYSPGALPKYGSVLFVAGAGFDNVTSAQLHTMIDGAADMGMTLLRVGAPWSLCQPSSAVFDATVTPRVDDVLAYCATKGIQVLLEVGTIPTWATGYTAPGKTPPTDQTQYKAWIAAALGRWGSYLYGIGLWNEPNNGTAYYTGTVAQLVNLHTWAMAQKAITAPAVKVFGGSLAFGDTAYLASLYAAGFKGKYDVLSIHPYNFTVFPATYSLDPAIPQAEGQVDSVGVVGAGYSLAGATEIMREVQITNTDLKPIAVTEYGFPTDLRAVGWPTTEAQQAAFLTTAARQAARIPYLDSLLFFKLADPPPISGGLFGIHRANLAHKTAYASIKTAIAALVAGTG